MDGTIILPEMSLSRRIHCPVLYVVRYAVTGLDSVYYLEQPPHRQLGLRRVVSRLLQKSTGSQPLIVRSIIINAGLLHIRGREEVPQLLNSVQIQSSTRAVVSHIVVAVATTQSHNL